MKYITKILVVLLLITLTACAPGSQFTLPPGMTFVPGTDIREQIEKQMATFASGALTQTAIAKTPLAAIPATATPIPGTPIPGVAPLLADTPTPIPAGVILPNPTLAPDQTLYQSPTLGIQFSYPSAWYRQESPSSVKLTSFEPSNPPHKLEWRYETTAMEFGFKVFITPPSSFDAWVEEAKREAQAEGWEISMEERFQIANQPAARLSLVSGSGGILNRVLIYELNGRYFEINIEGNYNNYLAKAVLDSIQPFSPGGLKPADMDTPAAGVCGGAPGDPVSIILGIDSSGMPLAGRCIAVDPAQRIKFTNQSASPFISNFAGYQINLPVDGEMLLDKPVGQYLALGVHFLPMGPELWVKATSVPTFTFTPLPPPAATVPPPIIVYSNSEVGYRLGLPGDWSINETNGANKQVRFSPPYSTDPNVIYLIIGLDFRTLDQIINYYAQNVPDAVREDVIFYGNPGIKYTYTYGRNEYFIPYGGQIFMIATDRPNDGVVQSILMTIQFITSSSTTYEATIMENGKTFNMKVGDYLKLNLDWSYDWSAVSVSNTSVIDGSQGMYKAGAPGSATLTATGNPKCYTSTPPCLAPSIIYTVNVVVQ